MLLRLEKTATLSDARAVAAAFRRVLRAWLSPAELDEIDARNAAENDASIWQSRGCQPYTATQESVVPKKSRKTPVSEQLRESIRASGLTHYALWQATGVHSTLIDAFMAGGQLRTDNFDALARSPTSLTMTPMGSCVARQAHRGHGTGAPRRHGRPRHLAVRESCARPRR